MLAVAVSALTAVAPASAAVQENDIMPLTNFTAPLCTGGLLTLNGQLHTLFTMTESGTHFSGSTHFQPVNLSGTDSAGNMYRGVGITQEHFEGSLVNGQFSDTFVNNFFMIGTRGAHSDLFQEVEHVTFNANGDLVASHDTVREVCH
jgi:hypothetical protein